MSQETEDIKMIRELMEKSTKFQSFNGLSIVFAGLFALVGAGYAYHIMNGVAGNYEYEPPNNMMLLIDGGIVLFLSVCVVTYFCWRKARVRNELLFSSTTRRAIYSILLPLITGGIFSLVFLFRGDVAVVCASTLIFYGLGLTNASKYTFRELYYLGIAEVILGLLSLFFIGSGLFFWALGFGIFHIIGGLLMYFRYEKNNNP